MRLLRATRLSLADHNRRHTIGLLPSPRAPGLPGSRRMLRRGGVGGGGSAYGNIAATRALLLPPEHLQAHPLSSSAQADDPVIAGLCREAPLLP